MDSYKESHDRVLLFAICVDVNDVIYPLALGVFYKENGDNMRWFIELLSKYTSVNKNIKVTFIYDHGNNIDTALECCWSKHQVRLYMKHILDNLINIYKVECLKNNY